MTPDRAASSRVASDSAPLAGPAFAGLLLASRRSRVSIRGAAASLAGVR